MSMWYKIPAEHTPYDAPTLVNLSHFLLIEMDTRPNVENGQFHYSVRAKNKSEYGGGLLIASFTDFHKAYAFMEHLAVEIAHYDAMIRPVVNNQSPTKETMNAKNS